MLNLSKFKIISIIAFCILIIFYSFSSLLNRQESNILPISLKKLLPQSNLNLGLDLQGGSQLTLQIDFPYYLKERLENFKNEIKSSFRKESVRALPKVKDEKIKFVVRNEVAKKDIQKIIRSINPQLKISSTDNIYEISLSDELIKKMQNDVTRQSIEIVRRRIDEHGTKEPLIQAQGKNRILLQVPGIKDSSQVKSLLGKTAKMTFHFVKSSSQDGQYMVPIPGTKLLYDKEGVSYLIDKEIILSGDSLVDANTTYFEGKPAVGFSFNNSGARKFSQITRENIGKIFAIVLDNEVVTAPRINTVINQGAGVISGSFTVEEAAEVALLLRAGALPAPLDIVEERSVGPSLGQDSINSGGMAALIGMLLVVIAMIVIYGTFGALANIALLFNIMLIIVALSFVGANLTLPGIAGIVLTIGMAVDSNVLIFERIKEELRQNKSVIIAVDQGFRQAYRTIIDSNITTLIVAFFLFSFGSGPVKGFAVTLSFGILSSMFSAIILTRMMIALWIRKNRPQKLNLT